MFVCVCVWCELKQHRSFFHSNCGAARAGLPSHPQHDLAKRQCKGFGGMVSFVMKGDLSNATTFTQRIKV